MIDKTVDLAMMRRALDLAARGEATTRPNPMVGAVVLSADGRVVGEGWHVRPGEPHAEPIALDQAGDAARGGVLYVTLEPCAHWGRTPPCTERIEASGVARVVIAARDSHKMAKGGVERLRAAGLKVEIGLLESEARRLNRPFFSVVERRRPWVTAKLAMSLDGRVATRLGESQWITGPEARAEGHRLRARNDAVLVGAGTVIADDPRLDARCDPPPERAVMRIVVDTGGRSTTDARIFDPAVAGPIVMATTTAAPTHVRDAWSAAGAQVVVVGQDPKGRVCMGELLRELAARGVSRLLVEGGPNVVGTLRDGDMIDEVAAFIAPRIIGGVAAPGAVGGVGPARLFETLDLDEIRTDRFGADLFVGGIVRRPWTDEGADDALREEEEA